MLAFGVASETDGKEIPDIVKYSFLVGVVAMLSTTIWSAMTTDEYPPDDIVAFRKKNEGKGVFSRAFKDIYLAFKEMPEAIKKLWWVKFFSWYALPLMWQYLALSIARHCFNAPTPESPGFAEGTANVGLAFTVMNVTTLVMAFMIPSIVQRFGNRATYSVFLCIAGTGFISMLFTNQLQMVLACMMLVGVGWAAIITIPFIIAADAVPAERVGVYMGLINAFICLPQIISMLTIGLFYETLLMNDPRNALVLAGVLLIVSGGFAMRLNKDQEILAQKGQIEVTDVEP
jgi:maltose/moltooligosaccharide transporter